MKKKNIIEQTNIKLKVVPGRGTGGARYSSKRDAHIINPENLHKKIISSKYLQADNWREERQYGHPKLIDVLEQAVEKVHEYINLYSTGDRIAPKFQVKDISPSDAWVKKNCKNNPADDPETADVDEKRAGCAFDGHKSHVNGLDADVAFLYHKINSGYFSKTIFNKNSIENIAAIENLIFLQSLTSNSAVYKVIVSRWLYNQLILLKKSLIQDLEDKIEKEQNPDQEQDIETKDPNMKQKLEAVLKAVEQIKINTGKLIRDGKNRRGSGHWRHFHVRLNFPDKWGDQGQKSITKSKTEEPPKVDNEEMTRAQQHIMKNASFVFGRVTDSGATILSQVNPDFLIEGASMQKLPALLLNLYNYPPESKDKDKRLTAYEMSLLLAYQRAGKRITKINHPSQGAIEWAGTHSNFIMRYLSRSKPHYYQPRDRNKKPVGKKLPWNVYTGDRGVEGKSKLGTHNSADLKRWSKTLTNKFGKSTIAGAGGNQQSSKDMFHLLKDIYTSSKGNGPINQEDAKLVISLMDRDSSYFIENYGKTKKFFKKGQGPGGFDREIYGLREDKNKSLKARVETYLENDGVDIKIDKIYGKGGWYRTLNFGVILEFNGEKYIFVCYTRVQLAGSKLKNLDWIAYTLARQLLRESTRAPQSDSATWPR